MIYSGITLFTALFFVHGAVGQIGGNLYFELIQYENRQDMLYDGSACEIFGGSCDPYFKFCIGLEKSSSGCELLSSTSPVFENKRSVTKEADAWKLKHPLKERIHSPVPQSLRVSVNTYEYDNFGPHQDSLISQHDGAIQIVPFPNARVDLSNVPVISLRRKDRAANAVTMNVRVYVVCDQFVFGRYCERQCRATEKFTCDEEGNKLCSFGWRGSDCHLVDECKFQPCAAGAECTYESENAANHICKCNGGSGPECYPGYDFCQDKPCKNGAICVSGNSSCLCIGPFYGSRCEHMRNLCEITPCVNNGTCLMSPTGQKMCLCTTGYEGDLCEIPIITTATADSKESDAVALAGQVDSPKQWIWATIAVLIILCAVAVVILIIWRLYWLAKRKQNLNLPRMVYSPDQDPFNIYEVPILSANFTEQVWSRSNRDSSSPLYASMTTPGNSEYVSMTHNNGNIQEDHVYEDCEKMEPFRVRTNEPIYAVPETVPLTHHDPIYVEQTRPLVEDENVYVNEDTYTDIPPPLPPLRNAPRGSDG